MKENHICGPDAYCDTECMDHYYQHSMNALRPQERATLELRLNDLLKFLNSPGDWGYDTPMADLTLYLLKFREQLNRT